MKIKLNAAEVASIAQIGRVQRSLTIFADNPRDHRSASDAAAALDYRVLSAGPPAGWLEALNAGVVGEAIMIDVSEDRGPPLDIFLHRVDALAHSSRLPVIINAAPECLDSVDALASSPGTILLSNPTLADRVSALCVSGAGKPGVLNDVIVDDSFKLQQLAEEVGRIARSLADIVGCEPVAPPSFGDGMIGYRAAPPVSLPHAEPTAVNARDVRQVIQLRRTRDRFFRSELFADPA